MQIVSTLKWYFGSPELKRRVKEKQKREDENYWLGRLADQEKSLTNSFEKRYRDQARKNDKKIDAIGKGFTDEVATLKREHEETLLETRRNYLVEMEKKDEIIYNLQRRMLDHTAAYDSYKYLVVEFQDCAQRLQALCYEKQLKTTQDTQKAETILGTLQAIDRKIIKNEKTMKKLIDTNQEILEVEDHDTDI